MSERRYYLNGATLLIHTSPRCGQRGSWNLTEIEFERARRLLSPEGVGRVCGRCVKRDMQFALLVERLNE